MDGKVNEMSFPFNSICFFCMLPATDLEAKPFFCDSLETFWSRTPQSTMINFTELLNRAVHCPLVANYVISSPQYSPLPS